MRQAQYRELLLEIGSLRHVLPIFYKLRLIRQAYAAAQRMQKIQGMLRVLEAQASARS